MRRFSVAALMALACAGYARPQGRPVDWPSFGGDGQRTGWEKTDSRITPENVKDFQLVLKRKLDNRQTGPRALTPPVVIGTLISYRGFKELAFVAGSSGMIWSIDADLDRMFWQKQLDNGSGDGACAAMVTAMPALVPPVAFGVRRPAALPPGTAAGTTPPPAPKRPPLNGGFGSPRPMFAVTSDGKLHRLNTATGDDQIPPVDFLPANAKASVLTIADGFAYTTTTSECGGAPNGVWAADLTSDDAKTAKFTWDGGAASGLGGYALGSDGTVYVQTGPGPMDTASGKWSNTLIALTPKTLQLSDYFTQGGPATGDRNAPTPVVFPFKGHDVVVAVGSDNSLFVLDAKSIGGKAHKTPLFETAPLTTGGQGVWGGLSTWQDADEGRWVAAPVWGPVSAELQGLAAGGAAPNGSIVAFKVEEKHGKPVLTPKWVSRDMTSPEPPVITSDRVFALAAGGTHATLFALDAATGKEIYSTGEQVTSPASLTGLTVVNGRVYFTTRDNTLYAFGVFLER